MEWGQAGPRRLTMDRVMPCGDGASIRRKAAALGCSAASGGRKSVHSVSLPWASHCSRRSDWLRTRPTQPSTAVQAW